MRTRNIDRYSFSELAVIFVVIVPCLFACAVGTFIGVEFLMHVELEDVTQARDFVLLLFMVFSSFAMRLGGVAGLSVALYKILSSKTRGRLRR